MSYQEPTLSAPGHSNRINYGLVLKEPFDRVMDELTMQALSVEGLEREPRADLFRRTRNALSVICANLLRAYHRDPNLYVVVPLGNDVQPRAKILPIRLGARAIRRAADFLKDTVPAYAEQTGANNNPETGKGYCARLRATKRLIEALEGAAISDGAFSPDPQSPLRWTLFAQAGLPVIRVKPVHNNEEDEASFPDYPPQSDDPQIRWMERKLGRYNEFLQDHWVDLLVPDSEMDKLQKRSSGDRDIYFGDKGRPMQVDLLFRRSLYRVFNNGCLGHGGRFYGGWWQNIPSEYRRAITINGHTTGELDYSSFHPSMLYAMEGKKPPSDCYALEGFPSEHRQLLKRTFNKLVNATGRIQAPKKDMVPEGWTWQMIQDGLRQLHAPISRHFQTGRGIELQRYDSDIAERVMLKMMREGILALPIHDSFIVWDTKQSLLREVMLDEYRRYMHHDIDVRFDWLWTEKNLSPEAHELHNHGVLHIEDSIYEYREGPEYSRYRQRMKDFMKVSGDHWGYRHSFLL